MAQGSSTPHHDLEKDTAHRINLESEPQSPSAPCPGSLGFVAEVWQLPAFADTLQL